MRTQRNKTVSVSCLAILILLAAGGLAAGAAAGPAVLPEGLVMADAYQPGRGRPVGRIQRVEGAAVILHAGILKGYEAQSGMRLYKDDTVITLENSRIRFRLNDGSVLSLASESRLTLNKSVYAKEKKQRSSFLNLSFGKARCVVVKLLNYKRSEFRVKTPTAVCGVRGSDFILEATATETSATALEKTEIELQSLAFPDENPLILNAYETSTVRRGQRPSPPAKLPPEEVERKKALFMDVAPQEDEALDSEDDSAAEIGDDSGVDEAAELGEEDLELTGADMPHRIPFIQGGKAEKRLPMPDDRIRDEIGAAELPDFPKIP